MTLFLEKTIIFLPKCHSTNEELAKRIKKFSDPEGTIIYTDYQDSGRGQRGNQWISKKGKNILMSVLLRPKFLTPSDQYYLNLIAGLSVVDVVKEKIPDAEVLLKWPNDVYLEGKKIAGILIESSLREANIDTLIIGIGLNVNQVDFDIPKATSLKFQAGISNDFDRKKIIEQILCQLENWYRKLKNGKKDAILRAYHQVLLWRGEIHHFKSASDIFKGEIIGIDSLGKLAIKIKEELKTFDIKEIEFIN